MGNDMWNESMGEWENDMWNESMGEWGMTE